MFVDDLKTDSENDCDKVKMPSFPSPEPTVSYSTDLDFFKDFENEFPAIVYNDGLTFKSDFLTVHIDSFENFHEIDYNVLVKLQECWWKVNAHEIALFTRTEKLRQGPYINMKTEWASNPYLDVNHVFRRDYEASNDGDI
ncbi:hypothetical protein Tco_1317983 [Tanacetum coccineum]